MQGSPRSASTDEHLILRDHLALDRTIMANERTLLAYIRTALAVLVVGASLIKFFKAEVYEIIGWVLLPIGIGVIVLGTIRYREMAARVHAAAGTYGRRPRDEA